MESLSLDSVIEGTQVDADNMTSVINIKLQMLGLRIYSGVIEIIKITFLILAILTMYEFLGLHDCWIQFLDKFIW